jgi:hypothetical protein
MATLNNSNCAYWDVFYEVCCRGDDIWNLAESSGQTFRIGATINIFNRSQNPFKNNSPILKNESVVTLYSGIEYILNSGAVDPDDDSLSYELSPALQQGGGIVNYQTPGSANYPFPLDSSKSPHINSPQPNGPYVLIDSLNGDISFNPLNNTLGLIFGNMNVRIKQWSYNANGIPLLVGITHRDILLFVLNGPANNPPRFITTPSLPNNQPKYNHEITAGQQLCFTITAKDTDVNPLIPRYDTTFISWNEGIVRPGKLTFLPNYTVTPNQPRPREDTWQFCWQTEQTDIRSLPYYFTVTAVDKFCPNIGQINKAFSIKVIAIGQAAPTITSFTPQTGTNGTLITINGTNLNNASSVTFGGVNAKSYTVVSPLIITAIVDSGATGNVSVVTPNGTALLNGFTYTTNTGIAKFASQSYSIFPNPVSAEIIIESNKSLNESRFELMDVNGKVLINTTCNTPTNRLIMDVKSLSPSMYLLRITSQGHSNTVKIIKQ